MVRHRNLIVLIEVAQSCRGTLIEEAARPP
jgi:hypothetical protein